MDEQEHQQEVDPAVLKLARFKARQLAGKYGFARHAAEDIQQDLLLDYLQRSRFFDSQRCSSRSFARLVTNNRIAALIEAQKAARRDPRGCWISLDHSPDHQDGPSSPRCDQLPLGAANPYGRRSVEWQLNLALDVERILSRLPMAVAQVCRLLMACESRAEAAARAGISRATLYRRIQGLQSVFRKSGMHG